MFDPSSHYIFWSYLGLAFLRQNRKNGLNDGEDLWASSLGMCLVCIDADQSQNFASWKFSVFLEIHNVYTFRHSLEISNF